MKPDRDATKTRAGKKPRKPYIKPACLSEQIFETTALACGKRPGRGGACNAAPRLS
jgi:hypothetical protein